MTAPRVAIVMPTYNSARHLVSTVESVLAQTFPDWQLVLFDDGSSDDTVKLSQELAARDDRIKVATGGHLGPAVARNEGLLRTDPTTEYVVFLDSDDTWEPDALATMVGVLDAHPDAVAAHALARATDMDGHQYDDDDLADSMRQRQELHGKELVTLPAGAPTTFAAMLLKNCVVTPGTSLLRRRELTAVGPLDPATSPGDDWDLNVRLARRGEFLFVDHTILNWRRHPDSLANTSRRWRQAQVVVRRRSIQSKDNTPEQRQAALDVLLANGHSWRAAALGNLKQHQWRSAGVGLAYVGMMYGEYVRGRLTKR
jgi:glycosyltransferase involved in cell wall biosynthesis